MNSLLWQGGSLLSLVRDGEDYNWWRVQYGNMPAMWEDIVSFEKDAIAIRNYEPAIVPGLLQTPDYTRAFAASANESMKAEEIDKLVDEHRVPGGSRTGSRSQELLSAVARVGAVPGGFGGSHRVDS